MINISICETEEHHPKIMRRKEFKGTKTSSSGIIGNKNDWGF